MKAWTHCIMKERTYRSFFPFFPDGMQELVSFHSQCADSKVYVLKGFTLGLWYISLVLVRIFCRYILYSTILESFIQVFIRNLSRGFCILLCFLKSYIFLFHWLGYIAFCLILVLIFFQGRLILILALGNKLIRVYRWFCFFTFSLFRQTSLLFLSHKEPYCPKVEQYRKPPIQRPHYLSAS